MEVIRVIKNKNYTTISNQLFKNKTISLKAKGLMAYLLSLPNDWNLSINGIVACSKEGRRAIGNTIKELISAGYIERNQIRDKGKFIGYDYFVFEQPKRPFEATDKSFTDKSIQISKEVIKERINFRNKFLLYRYIFVNYFFCYFFTYLYAVIRKRFIRFCKRAFRLLKDKIIISNKLPFISNLLSFNISSRD